MFDAFSRMLNIVFTDFKLRSAAGMIGRFPHVVAAVSNLAEESHLVGRLYDTLDGELELSWGNAGRGR